MCLHAGVLKRTALTMRMQLALHKKYRNKGCKNVSHKKTSRDVGMVLCVSQTQLWHGKTNWRKNVSNKEGYHSMQQPPNHTGGVN